MLVSHAIQKAEEWTARPLARRVKLAIPARSNCGRYPRWKLQNCAA